MFIYVIKVPCKASVKENDVKERLRGLYHWDDLKFIHGDEAALLFSEDVIVYEISLWFYPVESGDVKIGACYTAYICEDFTELEARNEIE